MEETNPSEPQELTMTTISVLGDYVPQMRAERYIKAGDVAGLFGEMESVIRESTLSIVNLEAPVVTSAAKPIVKTGPALNLNSGAIRMLKEVGCDVVTLANNHMLDYGYDSMVHTIDLCSKYGILATGIGKITPPRKFNNHITRWMRVRYYQRM